MLDADGFDQNSETLFAQGGARGSEELIAHYLPRLRAFVRARLGQQLRRRESESDIVQSVCRELVLGGSELGFEVEMQFRSWLFTAAMHKIQEKARYWNAGKRTARREESFAGTERDLDQLSRGYSSVMSPRRIAQAREQLERLEAALESLPEDHREVLAMARIARLPHAEIGRRMDRSVGAVRQLLGRALRGLAASLKEQSAG